MRVRDAKRVINDHAAVPVAEAGRLVGIIRATILRGAPDEATIGDVMEAPVFLHVDDAVDDVIEIEAYLGGGPVPVVDRAGKLFGVIAAEPSSDDT